VNHSQSSIFVLQVIAVGGRLADEMNDNLDIDIRMVLVLGIHAPLCSQVDPLKLLRILEPITGFDSYEKIRRGKFLDE
jgi:hypothetical protein